MDIDHGGIEKIGLFLFRLSDRRFVKTPWSAVLGRKHKPAAIRAEGDIPLLSGSIGDSFGLALIDGGDVDVPSNDKGKFFAVGAQSNFGDIVAVVPNLSGSTAVAQPDLYTDLLRLGCSGGKGVDLSVVTETEIAGVRYAEEPDRIPFEMSELFGCSGLTICHGEPPDVKRSALFVQVIDGVFIW